MAEPSFGWAEMPAAARTVATADGKVIGIPALVDNLALIYNKKLFDAAGVAYPTDDWSWDDFRAAAKKLTNPATNTYGTAYSVSGSEDTTWHLWPLLWQHGGKILDGTKPAFNSDAGVEALETLRQMAVDDKSMYLDQTDEKYGPLFNSGHVGDDALRPVVAAGHQGQPSSTYGVADLPGLNGDHQTVSGPDLWVLFDHDDANRAGAVPRLHQVADQRARSTRSGTSRSATCRCAPPRRTRRSSPPYVKEYPGGQKFFDNLANAKQARPTVARLRGDVPQRRRRRSPRCCRARPRRRRPSTRRPSKSADASGGLMARHVRGDARARGRSHRESRPRGRPRPRRSGGHSPAGRSPGRPP